MTAKEWNRKSLKNVREKTLLKDVIRAAKYHGWMIYHSYDSRMDSWKKGIDTGFPDLIMIRQKSLLVVELKRQGKKPTDNQNKWLSSFQNVKKVKPIVLHPEGFGQFVDTLGKENN